MGLVTFLGAIMVSPANLLSGFYVKGSSAITLLLMLMLLL